MVVLGENTVFAETWNGDILEVKSPYQEDATGWNLFLSFIVSDPGVSCPLSDR